MANNEGHLKFKSFICYQILQIKVISFENIFIKITFFSLPFQTQTEWQQYLTQCIECIALVAESRPNAVFAQVFSHWSRPHLQLQAIENDIDCGKTFELARKLRSQLFAEHLRDFSTVCQAVVRIAPLLDVNAAAAGDAGSASEVNCHLNILAENLLTTLKFFTSNKLNAIDVDHSSFQTDYDYL